MQLEQRKSGRAGGGRAVALPSGRPYHYRLPLTVLGLCLGMVCGPAIAEAQESAATGNLPFTDPYAFVDRFMDLPEVKELGFPARPEPVLNLGVIVDKEEAENAGTPIDFVSATASNGQVTFELVYADIGILELWDNFGVDSPVFDPKSHKGTWTITGTGSKGASASPRPVLLEYGFELPFVQNVTVEETASGDLTVGWSVPELDPEIAAKCDVAYRLRLLENINKQLYRSDETTGNSVIVPGDTLKEKAGGDLEGVWGRIEMGCRDKDEKQRNNAGVGQLEARSNTFFPLR